MVLISNHLRRISRSLQGKLVSCVTKDDLHLYGFFRSSGDTVLAHTHGTASAYGIEAFEVGLDIWAEEMGWGFLTYNNRGAHVLEDWQKSGAAVEKFSDSPIDIISWLNFLKSNDVKKVILSGHSLGTEKIVNFARKNQHPMVIQLLLLSPSDSYGCQKRWEDMSGKIYMKEAIHKTKHGKGALMLDDPKAHAGLLPISAESYIDFFSEDSDIRKALPFGEDSIEKLPIPTWAIVPKTDEWNVTSPQDYQLKLEKAGASVNVVSATHDLEYDILSTLKSFQ